MSFEEEGANVTETAEPSAEEQKSANSEEVADPTENPDVSESDTEDVQDDETNHAFAEIRRAKEQAEARVAELEKQAQERDDEQKEADFERKKQAQLDEARRIGEEQGLSDEDIEDLQNELIEDLEREAEIEEMRSKLEQYETSNAELRAQQMMAEDLSAIQKIDPTVKSIADLGESFQIIRTAMDDDGNFLLTPEQAYFASKAYDGQLEAQKPKAAQEPGFDDTSQTESATYTREQLEAMSEEEINANWDKVMKSLKTL